VNKAKTVILLAVLIDVIGFGIVIPILPFYVTEFGASPTTITVLFATFSLFAFMSAPMLGAISDRVGRRPMLIVSMLSSAIGWFVFAGAQSLWMLFLGRIIDGAAAGNFTLAQSYIVDISRDERERTTNLGMVGAVFGVGFILGPLLGGILSNVSHAFPFAMAGVLAALNAIGAFFLLPETHTSTTHHQPIHFNPLRPLIRAIRDEKLRPIYITWALFAGAIVIGQSVFALFLRDVFGFTAYGTGLAFTILGVVLVLNQAVLLKRLWLQYFSDRVLEIIMLALLAAASLLIATENLTLFYVGLLGLGTGQAIIRVVVASQAAGASSPTQKGETMGIISAIMSAAMATAPVVSGVLFEIDHAVPYIVCTLLFIVGFVFAIQKPRTEVAAS
jgi:MFS transporter, DHA1 family, tetracycline resistance protein